MGFWINYGILFYTMRKITEAEMYMLVAFSIMIAMWVFIWT